MESLSETVWDAVISGTGLQHSLLALALSRSNKKILHVDHNEYYGGSDAAFSLQEADEWVEKNFGDASAYPFRNASLWKADAEQPDKAGKLSFSRAYTLTLSPRIIYTRSKLLAQLVSSKVYRQLEFQAVGNWWILDGLTDTPLKRLPNGREDIFHDKSIDNRSKRSLMKFLKFVVDYENQAAVWEPYANDGLASFLSSQFQFPQSLQNVISALTLSHDAAEETTVQWAIPRIARHLTSIGMFGPGFGAVVPKWGGGAEISQVACRAGAVGGGVYVLGTGIRSVEKSATANSSTLAIELSNGETVKAKKLIDEEKAEPSNSKVASKVVAIIASSLQSLFKSTVEGSPLAAVSVVVLPPNTVVIDDLQQAHPIYIMVHSSETGECPAGQCVLYISTLYSEQSKKLLEAALLVFLTATEHSEDHLMYSLYYEQCQTQRSSTSAEASEASLDLAFNDDVLDDVQDQWRSIMCDEVDEASFMKFEDREGVNADDDDADEGY